mgnify:FL=1
MGVEKIARICWNTCGWKQPSGREGKSLSEGSYEKELGFGHEEWLLDRSRIINGYHYGFLQPMNTKSGKHQNATYDIHLFTINPRKQNIYIGCLHNACGVTNDEAEYVFEYYKKHGWIDEMKKDILYVGGTPIDFKPFMFNVKFKFSDVEIDLSNSPIIEPKSIGHRYNLMDKKGDFRFLKDEAGKIIYLDTSTIYRVTSAGTTIIDPVHKKIQNAVYDILKDQYAKLCLENEQNKGEQRVDIKGVLKDNPNEWHYFEVKTSSARHSIREALGQILEYNHYPATTRAKKMFIIGPEKPDDLDIQYLRRLREVYNIPVWFRWYSFEDNTLSKLF